MLPPKQVNGGAGLTISGRAGPVTVPHNFAPRKNFSRFLLSEDHSLEAELERGSFVQRLFLFLGTY